MQDMFVVVWRPMQEGVPCFELVTRRSDINYLIAKVQQFCKPQLYELSEWYDLLKAFSWANGGEWYNKV